MTERRGARDELPSTRSFRIVWSLLFRVVIAGLLLRLLWLDRLTGIDGDEAWHGALAQRWAGGDLTLWRTPTGNYPGPIQPALVALGQFFLPSQFILLRIPSVLSSLAAMALAWWIGRRHFDAATGRMALMLTAVLPGNIAYARFGWDPSHSGMIVLAGIALALERQLALTVIVYALAVWTHPTNVFAAPLLLPIFGAAEWQAGERRLLIPRLGLLAALMALLTAAMMATASQAGQFVDEGAILTRLLTPADWLSFLLLLGRLMAGEPWFVHLAGSGYGPLMPLVDFAGLAMLAATLWFATRTLKVRGLSLRGGVLLGWLAMVAAYALIGGFAPLNPPTERYAFVLVAPTALVMAMVLRAGLGQAAGRLLEALVTAIIGTALIAATIAFYLVPLATRDGIGVNAFKTGPVEPKEAAARWLATEARRGGPVRLVAEDWWLYWPLAYRLAGQPIELVDAEARPRAAARGVPGRTFDIAFAGSSMDRRLATARGSSLTWTARGYDGRAVIRIWERVVKP